MTRHPLRHVCDNGHEPVSWRSKVTPSPCWFCGATGTRAEGWPVTLYDGLVIHRRGGRLVAA